MNKIGCGILPALILLVGCASNDATLKSDAPLVQKKAPVETPATVRHFPPAPTLWQDGAEFVVELSPVTARFSTKPTQQVKAAKNTFSYVSDGVPGVIFSLTTTRLQDAVTSSNIAPMLAAVTKQLKTSLGAGRVYEEREAVVDGNKGLLLLGTGDDDHVVIESFVLPEERILVVILAFIKPDAPPNAVIKGTHFIESLRLISLPRNSSAVVVAPAGKNSKADAPKAEWSYEGCTQETGENLRITCKDLTLRIGRVQGDTPAGAAALAKAEKLILEAGEKNFGPKYPDGSAVYSRSMLQLGDDERLHSLLAFPETDKQHALVLHAFATPISQADKHFIILYSCTAKRDAECYLALEHVVTKGPPQ